MLNYTRGREPFRMAASETAGPASAGVTQSRGQSVDGDVNRAVGAFVGLAGAMATAL
jgi:hypothetical protein